jgi:hypothetical protein
MHIFDDREIPGNGTSNPGTLTLLRRPICAIQIERDEVGKEKLGLIAQLGTGTPIQVCGPGFNRRTMRVSVNGLYFFVFAREFHEATNKSRAASASS